ncbi:LCP family protein [Streptacidiphilus sp. PAMC 29251]
MSGATPAVDGARDGATGEIPGGTPAPGRAARRKAQRGTRRKVLKSVGWTLAVVLVAAGGGVGYVYMHLSGNIKSAPLYSGGDKAKAVGVEKPDPFGRTPYNLLLIGSDTRASAGDAKLGGDAGVGANADVQMLVHLSADRSNITVVSIPRDTVTQLPDCAHDATGLINSSLQTGPSCTAAAVHKLTGITVDAYAMVDFSGVVDMSNALGGVNVCVSSNMYDIYSGLKLTKGTHNLKGKAALEFLRTRHAFGSGSDSTGRTTATHIFFTDMINKLKTEKTVTDSLAMYRIADAATKALTVSDNLNTIPKLIGLADDLNKVATDRITFTTMQNVAYSGTNPLYKEDVQEDTAGAPVLFNAIINDQSLTSAGGGSTATGQPSAPTTPAGPALSTITVGVYNGTSVNGRSDALAADLVKEGFNRGTAGYSDSVSPATTTLTYGPGDAAKAEATAKALGLPAKALKQGSAAGLKLVIGADWTSGSTFPGSKPVKPAVDTKAALSNANVQTANQSNRCAQVGTEYTEPGHTPAGEFAAYPNVPNSAP